MGQPVRRAGVSQRRSRRHSRSCGSIRRSEQRPHGALCGSLLPFGLALNETQISDERLRQRFADVRQWLAAGLDADPNSAWESLREWSQRSGLGNLRELGVPREALEPAALAASSSSSMKANPVMLTSEQLLEMLEAAWE